MKAYFAGCKLVAISSLVPVVEGIIRKVATSSGRDVGQGTRRINKEFRAFVDQEMNSPGCYGERVVMLERLREFVEERLLATTTTYCGLNELNRHGILRGIFTGFDDDLNFFRMISILDLLCFAIGLKEGGISCFGPAPTDRSTKLAIRYICLQAISTIPIQ